MKVEIDSDSEIITIQGMRYSFDLFKSLARIPQDRYFNVISRVDGVVSVSEWTKDALLAELSARKVA